MPSLSDSINQHYTHENFSDKILAALTSAGKDINALSLDDLKTFDEFHVRGFEATKELAKLAGLNRHTKLLDLGSGIGGPARSLAHEYGCTVVGLDLVEEFCKAATMLTEKIHLDDKVSFKVGDMTDLPFQNHSFDVSWSQHTTMNIENKSKLFSEVHRVTKPTGRYVLYEICAGDNSPIHFPVPWASTQDISFLLTPDELKSKLIASGFEIREWLDVTDLSADWFKMIFARLASTPKDLPQPPGPGLVLGKATPEKLQNTLRNLEENRICIIMAAAVPV